MPPNLLRHERLHMSHTEVTKARRAPETVQDASRLRVEPPERAQGQEDTKDCTSSHFPATRPSHRGQQGLTSQNSRTGRRRQLQAKHVEDSRDREDRGHFL